MVYYFIIIGTVVQNMELLVSFGPVSKIVSVIYIHLPFVQYIHKVKSSFYRDL